MIYEIGQRVTTPLGDGEVVALGSAFNGVESYRVRFTLPKDGNGYLHPIVEFPNYHLKPYKTPHERLIDMGFEIYNSEHKIQIMGNSLYYIIIHKKAKQIDSLGKSLTFDLWKIFAEYLEWLEEQK